MRYANSVLTTPRKLTRSEAEECEDLLNRMKLKKMCARAMFLLTNELIYKLGMETIDETRKVLKKLVSGGTSIFATERNTKKLLEKFARHYKAYEAMIYKMEIAMMPTRADKIITQWLKETHPEELAKIPEADQESAVVDIVGVMERSAERAVMFWEFTV